MEALVVKAVIPALEAFPEFNATIDGDDLVLHHSFDIGIAVDTPDGLLVAVIDDAGSMGVLELAAEVRRLGDGAKARSSQPGELTGQTFTVTNIGAVGGGHGTPIVPYGTTAILSLGRAQEKVVVVDGELAIAPVMPLSLSYDHRVVDGGSRKEIHGIARREPGGAGALPRRLSDVIRRGHPIRRGDRGCSKRNTTPPSVGPAGSGTSSRFRANCRRCCGNR